MTQDSLRKRLLLIELNEFSVELFQRGVRELKLPSIARLLALKATKTITDDQVEHRGLDPWVQWVSAHTGFPSSVHRVTHLGDTPSNLCLKQIWEVLSENGVSSGIWGAMNATRESAEHCAFFLPDPWTFSEQAYPDELNGLLSLPRYYSKNYLDLSVWEFARRTARLSWFVLGSGAVWRILRQMPLVLPHLLRSGINNAFLFSLFDLFSACIFVGYKGRYDAQLSVIFLNSIAHLQHHRWKVTDRLSNDIRFGLQTIDRVLEILFSALSDSEALIVMNALTQKNIADEKPRICYRQINPAKFLNEVDIKFQDVEQLMTNDAHVFFADANEYQGAVDKLVTATIASKPLFDVDTRGKPQNKLFFQVDFWDEVDDDVTFEIGGRQIRFLDHFDAIVARTGAHVPEGNLFAVGVEIPDRMYNHELAQQILTFFGVSSAAPLANVSNE